MNVRYFRRDSEFYMMAVALGGVKQPAKCEVLNTPTI